MSVPHLQTDEFEIGGLRQTMIRSLQKLPTRSVGPRGDQRIGKELPEYQQGERRGGREEEVLGGLTTPAFLVLYRFLFRSPGVF